MVTKQWILSRLSEPSTWRGIILVLTAAGVQLQPAMIEAVISIGIGAAGVIGMVTADKKAQNTTDNTQ